MALFCTLLCTYNLLCIRASRPTNPHSATSNLSDEARTTTLADTLWWATFNDSHLDSLIAQALAYNHNLHAAAARLKAARAQAKMAGAPLYPQISAGIIGIETQTKLHRISHPRSGGW